MNAALCIALFAVGHVIRDGWPALGTTHGARALGAVVCGIGALFAAPPLIAGAVSLAVLAGFYFDRRHAQGQNALTPDDTDWLMLSGLTSIAPIALVAPFAVLAGCLKPLVWIAAWKLNPARWWAWAEPTRVAAMVFGAVIGAAIVLQQGVLGALP